MDEVTLLVLRPTAPAEAWFGHVHALLQRPSDRHDGRRNGRSQVIPGGVGSGMAVWGVAWRRNQDT